MSTRGSPAMSLVIFKSLIVLLFASYVRATPASFNKFISYDNVFVDPKWFLSGAWNISDTIDAQQTLVAYADNLMAQGPWSVTFKKAVAPSGDKHDYASWAPYYWPDCSHVGNKTELTPEQIWVTCPYTARDGIFNPDFRYINDTGSFAGLADTVLFTSMAWVITGKDAYAASAVSHLNTWFLDPETYMNPNLLYAQVIRGPQKAGGNHFGILDFKNMAKIATGILIFREANYTGYVGDFDNRLTAWFKNYTQWLATSAQGKGELAFDNNHGTFAFNQMASLQILIGDKDEALTYLKRYFAGQYQKQIAANGEQPLEAERSRTYHYRAYNLGAMITNAKLAAYLGWNAWNATAMGGATIQTALDFAMQFDPATTNEVTSAPAEELWPHVAAVASAYGDPSGKYAAYLNKVDNKYPQSPYFLWERPVALPQGYAVTKPDGSPIVAGSGSNNAVGTGAANVRMAFSSVQALAILFFTVILAVS